MVRLFHGEGDVLRDLHLDPLDIIMPTLLLPRLQTLRRTGYQPQLHIDIDPLRRERHLDDALILRRTDGGGLVEVVEGYFFELELERLDLEMGEGADGGGGGCGGGGRGDVDVGDVADVDVAGEDGEGGDVDVFEDELDFGVFVLGAIVGRTSTLDQ